jgi:hypothetical protein
MRAKEICSDAMCALLAEARRGRIFKVIVDLTLAGQLLGDVNWQSELAAGKFVVSEYDDGECQESARAYG